MDDVRVGDELHIYKRVTDIRDGQLQIDGMWCDKPLIVRNLTAETRGQESDLHHAAGILAAWVRDFGHEKQKPFVDAVKTVLLAAVPATRHILEQVEQHPPASRPFRAGDRVRHPAHGEFTVNSITDDGYLESERPCVGYFLPGECTHAPAEPERVEPPLPTIRDLQAALAQARRERDEARAEADQQKRAAETLARTVLDLTAPAKFAPGTEWRDTFGKKITIVEAWYQIRDEGGAESTLDYSLLACGLSPWHERKAGE